MALEIERCTAGDFRLTEGMPVRFSVHGDAQLTSTWRMKVQSRLKGTVGILRTELAKLNVIYAAVYVALEAVQIGYEGVKCFMPGVYVYAELRTTVRSRDLKL